VRLVVRRVVARRVVLRGEAFRVRLRRVGVGSVAFFLEAALRTFGHCRDGLRREEARRREGRFQLEAFLVVFFFGVDFFVVFFGAALRVRVVRLVVLLRVGMCNSSLYADAPNSSPTIISGNWFYLVIENSIVI